MTSNYPTKPMQIWQWSSTFGGKVNGKTRTKNRRPPSARPLFGWLGVASQQYDKPSLVIIDPRSQFPLWRKLWKRHVWRRLRCCLLNLSMEFLTLAIIWMSTGTDVCKRYRRCHLLWLLSCHLQRNHIKMVQQSSNRSITYFLQLVELFSTHFKANKRERKTNVHLWDSTSDRARVEEVCDEVRSRRCPNSDLQDGTAYTSFLNRFLQKGSNFPSQKAKWQL